METITGLKAGKEENVQTIFKILLTLLPQFETVFAHTETTNTSHMRTKTLMLTAALVAAGVVSSQAEVFSVNAVGYVNVALPAGFTMIANPLNNANNNLNTVLPLPPSGDGTVIYRFANGAFGDEIAFVDGFGWFSANADPNWLILNPGEGVFIKPSAPTTLTFVGEVPQGNLSNPIPSGFSIRASQVPAEANLGDAATAGTLLFPATDGDTVYVFDNAVQAYKDVYTYFDGLGWNSASDADVKGPVIKPGTSFWINKVDTKPWTRTFSVNN